MALTACRECGREVSVAAKTCPGCGIARPDTTQARRKVGADVALVIGLSVIGLLVVFGLLNAVL